MYNLLRAHSIWSNSQVSSSSKRLFSNENEIEIWSLSY